MRCLVVGGYVNLAPTAAAEVPYLEMQIGYVEGLARLAAGLDCSVVRVFSAYESPGEQPQAIWQGMVKALQEMCDRAAVYR